MHYMSLASNKTGVFFILMFVFMTNMALASEASIRGNASYLERIALPSNAIFEATLEDVSLMDVASVTLGSTVISPAGQIPIAFEIKYNTDDLKKGHRYSVRAKITVDDTLLYITDTSNPVLNGKDDKKLQLVMKRIKRSSKQQSPKVSPFSNFPIHFLGLLPGANCKSQYQLDLFADHTYFIRNRCFKGDGSESIVSDDIGRWYFNAENKQLTLKGGRESPLLFSVLDPQSIEKLDHSGKKIESDLNYKLESSQTAQTLEPKVFMQGMYRYIADAALFKECSTGLKLPVLFEKNNLALERAYLKDKKVAGALLKIHVAGTIVQRPKMEGAGMKAHLLVERFIKTMPNEQCGNQYVDASFSNTYWKLTSLYGEGVKKKSNNREAHIIFKTLNDGEKAFKGASGCNAIFGNYIIEGKNLSIDHRQIAMTKMACPDSNIEKGFLLVLNETTQWQIKGDHLELLDESSKILARFEAINF